jgi:hypothetical protein
MGKQPIYTKAEIQEVTLSLPESVIEFRKAPVSEGVTNGYEPISELRQVDIPTAISIVEELLKMSSKSEEIKAYKRQIADYKELPKSKLVSIPVEYRKITRAMMQRTLEKLSKKSLGDIENYIAKIWFFDKLTKDLSTPRIKPDKAITESL